MRVFDTSLPGNVFALERYDLRARADTSYLTEPNLIRHLLSLTMQISIIVWLATVLLSITPEFVLPSVPMSLYCLQN